MTLPVPVSNEPDVSLVMVVYGQYELSRATLASLADSADVPFEVIVVDNASPDGAGGRLRDEVTGPAYILNETNYGFGTAVNIGALHCRGRHIGILNSDLEFEDRWLSTLCRALDDDDSVGAAVPLYVHPSGDVLDAGRLLGADGVG